VPLTASSESRISSASNRRMFEPPVEAVLRIHLCRRRVVRGAHGVGAGEHQELVHLLERPAVVHEAARKPVQQFGICGLLAQQTEVVGGATSPWPKCQRQMRFSR